MPYNKYRVSKKADRTLDGIVFASKLEMNRYAFLKLMLSQRKIWQLELQPSFEILPKFEHKGTKHRAVKYVADFKYFVGEDTVIEDTKGMITDDANNKIKFFLSQNPNVHFYIIKDANEIGGIEIEKGVR